MEGVGNFALTIFLFEEHRQKKKIKFKLSMDTEVFTPFKYAKNRGKNSENGIASLNEVDVQTAWK